MSVLFLPEISKQFVELAEILYDKGYMSFLDAAIEYSESLFRDIQTNLPLKVHRKAPAYFNRFGRDMSYASFPIVRYISNNHVIAHHLELES